MCDVCDGVKSVDHGVGNEVDDGVDFHVSSYDDDVEPHKEKESICNSQSVQEASFEDNAELDSSVSNGKEAPNASQYMLNSTGVVNDQVASIAMPNLSSMMGTNNDESLLEAEDRGYDNIEPQRDNANQHHDSEVL